MWGPATALAISEQYRIAEEHTFKVRAELFRLRCTDEIFVEQVTTSLRLTYGDESVVKQPLRLQAMLKEIQHVEDSGDLWILLQKEDPETHCSLWGLISLLVLLVVFAMAVVVIAL